MNEKDFLRMIAEKRNLLHILSTTRDKVSSCANCIYKNHPRVLAPINTCQLLVVTDPPFYQDGEMPFSSKKWQILKQIVGGSMVETTFLNCTLCPKDEGYEPKIKAINCCKPLLFHLIKSYEPAVILAMGASALKALDIKSPTMGGIYKYYGTPVLATYSFRNIFEDYSTGYALVGTFLEHVGNAVDIIFNDIPKITYNEIFTEQISPSMLNNIPSGATVAFDIETAAPNLPKESGLKFRHPKHKMTVFSFSYKNDIGCVIDYTTYKATGAVKKFLQRTDIVKVVFNGAFDIGSLQHKLNCEIKGPIYDVLLMAYICMPERIAAAMEGRGKATLKSLVTDFIPEWSGYETNASIGIALKTDWKALKPIWDTFLRYAGIDSVATLKLFHIFKEKIGEERLDKLTKIVNPILLTVINMEKVGVPVDVEYLEELKSKLLKEKEAQFKAINNELPDWPAYAKQKELDRRNAKRKNKLTDLPGNFLFEPTKHVADLLYSPAWLGEPITTKTKAGKGAIDENILIQLSDKHPILKKIVVFRKCAKSLDLINNILNHVENDGRIHCKFKQVGTRTDRFSARPNLQQIPEAIQIGDWKAEIRKGIKAPKGKIFLYADYKNLEIYVLAFYCYKYDQSNTNLLEALKRGEDIHSYVAATINDLDYEYVLKNKEDKTKSIRKLAKAAIFGVIYGVSAQGLAKSQGISVEEAIGFLEKVFDRFPEIKTYIDAIHYQAREKRYVETLFGFRRYLPILEYQPWNKRVLRQAQNSPIQGTAGEIGKIATALLKHYPLEDKEVHINIHDAIITSIHPEKIEEGKKMYQKCMCDYFNKFDWCKTPLCIDFKTGVNWGELC